MEDPTVADPIPDLDAIPIPSLYPTFVSDEIASADNHFISFDENDDVLDFDFTFDDINLPSDTEEFFNSTFSCSIPVIASDPEDTSLITAQGSSSKNSECLQLPDDPSFNVLGYLNVSSSDSAGFSMDTGVESSDVPKVLNCSSPEFGHISSDPSSDAGILNVSSSDSRDFSQESGNKPLDVSKVSNCTSPELEAHNGEHSGPTSSQGSGSYGSGAMYYPSPDSDNCARSVASSPNSRNNSRNGAADRKIKLEDTDNNSLLKRKKENEDVNSESTRIIKCRRSNAADQSIDDNTYTDEEEKRKARLMRNRESAQLSRQRKKHYVEELEDKVRAMHSTIQELNAKISYVVAENATLKQQMGGGGALGPPPMPPPPGMYPHLPMAPMGYPWMHCPPYVVKPQGSQVPLVPIPRLKTQQPLKATKKGESKKTEGKTKKVASVSFLGLLFFLLLFGGLVPMVNVKYRGMQDVISGGSDLIGNRFCGHRGGRILMVNGTNHNTGTRIPSKSMDSWKKYNNTLHSGKNHDGGTESTSDQSSSDGFAHSGNASEPLVASLYVPRNDKLVKIDGNLIIHSVLASEKAMASREDRETRGGMETSLAVAFDLVPTISVLGAGQNNGRHPHLYRSTERQRALSSISADEDNLKSTTADGKLQQWFREGLAGPMLSSGTCTEVFQFDASPASTHGAIIPATAVRNTSVEQSQNSTHLNKGRNRRILHNLPIPLSGSSNNNTPEEAGSDSPKENSQRNNSLSPMVVSVLVDPREVGDAEGDGVMRAKSLSRIFVVVLVDSVKYVTYSCMLPFKGSGHLVTA